MSRMGANIFVCQAIDCSYNHDNKCQTIGINVGGPEPWCDTYVDADIKGGMLNARAVVGACKVGECIHNVALECMASNIRIMPQLQSAQCVSYQVRE